MQRLRPPSSLPFEARMLKEAEKFRQQAAAAPPGPVRDDLLRKARQAETAAHIHEWVSSPGLRPPVKWLEKA